MKLFFFSPATATWSFWLIMAILMFLTSLGGLMFGMMVSIMSTSTLTAFMVAQYVSYPLAFIGGESVVSGATVCLRIFLSGVIWPIEGIPKGLRFFCQFSPFASATITFRRLLADNLELFDLRVFTFSIQSLWILLFGRLSLWFIREKKLKTQKK
jgi:ABC-type uncharacterized transport system permease subunit